jgi:hypothetical protein
MTVKGALIAAMAAGYIATATPVAANAGDAEKEKTAAGEKGGKEAACKAAKSKGKKAKKEGEKAEGEKAEGEKPAEPAPAK